MLEIGAIVMGTETELILKSRRVVPARLLESGFVFTYPDWPDAALDLVPREQNSPDMLANLSGRLEGEDLRFVHRLRKRRKLT